MPKPESPIFDLKHTGELAAERIEINPWTHWLRAAKAEAEYTDDRRAIDDFVKWFKAWEARQVYDDEVIPNAEPKRRERRSVR